ncbi:MATE family efflux transporter [Compostimonas suwonensis]|uniref:Putative MATE family efflux protein n=1 Tax=Compostimonas suwonensis TaxID=1048394 RepID=A0A2M9C464_9MICO|nr:MATE family efflux transporter [Compostimonas suwonensis]PJJ65257.1 putative MATE family efflux protein [Compostimonas suwonensis]
MPPPRPARPRLFARQAVDRDILRLAVPALGALVAEPLFLLADSAMVGHLGEIPLAGLGIASAILQTIIGLMVFLAYSTTPAVARRLGSGDPRGAVAVGIDGAWLALGIGAVLAVAGWFASPWLVAAFGAQADVAAAATSYLEISMLGLPAMLLVFATTGLLRGLQDTRTPLLVAAIGFAANIVFNAVLIYGFGLGVVGSAIGTVVAQWGMALVYLVVVTRHARRVGATLLPRRTGIGSSARSGGWLFVRTASLRAAMLLAVATATSLGTSELAAFQIVLTLFSTLAFSLDALAIAAQALIGKGLGGHDLDTVRAVLRRCLQWGLGSGAVLGLVVLLLSPVLGGLFTATAAVAGILPLSLAVLAVSTPLAGYVFVLDGVLIGAGDARYLALTGVVNLAVFVPLALGAAAVPASPAVSLALLTASFAIGYLGARAVTLGLRAHGTRWMVPGAVR